MKGGLGDMMKQAKEMQSKMVEMQEQLLEDAGCARIVSFGVAA